MQVSLISNKLAISKNSLMSDSYIIIYADLPFGLKILEFSIMRLVAIEFIKLSVFIWPVPCMSMLPKATSECLNRFLNSILKRCLIYLMKWCLQSGIEALLYTWEVHGILPWLWQRLQRLLSFYNFAFECSRLFASFVFRFTGVYSNSFPSGSYPDPI